MVLKNLVYAVYVTMWAEAESIVTHFVAESFPVAEVVLIV